MIRNRLKHIMDREMWIAEQRGNNNKKVIDTEQEMNEEIAGTTFVFLSETELHS